jgi:CRISPR-associated endonuclease Csn1
MRKLHDPASRFVDEFGEADKERRVFARPGALTARLRQAWGVEKLKKGVDGKRVEDDRHHALDAIVIAATSERMLQALTEAFKREEARGGKQDFKRVEEPWLGFRGEAEAAMQAVFVSRAERRRVRGEAHAATIKQVRERDGKSIVYERKAVEKLTEKDLANVKDAERNAALIANLRAWIEAGRQKGTWPLSPKGDQVRKVRLATKDKVAVQVREGTADRGEMARVDVFRKQNKRGKAEFYLVPIYPHQIADELGQAGPPNRAVKGGGGPEGKWTEIDESFSYSFSLSSMSLVQIVKPDGEIIQGYVRSMDRNTGAFTVSPHQSLTEIRKGIGAKTLQSFKKLSVDRLGRVTEVQRELRTWRGKVCTSAGPQSSP